MGISTQERQGDRVKAHKVEALRQGQLGLFGWAKCTGMSI